jgi:hypothetical protein
MRTLVLMVMMALLPMRMWAAEGMSIRMAVQEVAVAAGGVAIQSAMPEDCPMMAKADAGGHESPQPAGQCMACQLCAATACFPEIVLQQGPVPTGPPQGGQPSYASADLPRDLRPPIS